MNLSEEAWNLLRLHAQCDTIRVDDSNREAHRELADAGLMVAMSTFIGGREARYRFTEKGWKLANAPWLEESGALRP